MRPKLWLMVIALVLVTSCEESKRQDAQAEVVTDTVQHIEKAAPLVARLSKLTELTPAYEVATALRVFAHELEQWRRDYVILRAKVAGRGVSGKRESEITRQYGAAIEDVKTKVAQAERRITKRSDVQLFSAELRRVREVIRDLQ